jgi:hypothetical protein
VVSGLQHDDVVILDEVDEAVLGIDPSRPTWSTWRSGSGLPMPSKGSRIVSSMSRLIRFTIALSVDCQWR